MNRATDRPAQRPARLRAGSCGLLTGDAIETAYAVKLRIAKSDGKQHLVAVDGAGSIVASRVEYPSAIWFELQQPSSILGVYNGRATAQDIADDIAAYRSEAA